MNMVTRRQHRLRRFLVASVLLGILVTGVTIPVTAAVGLASRNAVNHFENLPSTLAIPPTPERSIILASDGSVIATFYSQNRVDVSITSIATVMQQAIVAIEDSRFYLHGGVDVHGLLRALASNGTSGDIQQGGSTITQQYVKNVLITTADTAAAQNAARARTLDRKLQEARYAIALEKQLTKQQILDDYLNIAYFGDGAYGVEEASRHYFGVHASALTLAQAATLAGIVQNPSGYAPTLHPQASKTRRGEVLDRMVQLGYITAAQAAPAKSASTASLLHVVLTPNGCVTSYAPYFCDYVRRVLLTNPAFGATAQAREDLVNTGGLTIRTTLSPTMQKAAQAQVNKQIPPTDKSHLGTSVVMVEPGTGAIRAMAENRTWGGGKGQSTYNYSVDNNMGGLGDMQAGSTFKAFTIAAALEAGYTPDTVIRAPGVRTFTNFQNCKTGQIFPPYTVTNSTGAGTFTMAQATALSINTYFVQLEKQVGLCGPTQIASALGVHDGSKKPQSISQLAVPSFTLGSMSVSPLTMANAYATFAAHGMFCQPTAITAVTDRSGKSITVPSSSCTQAIPAGVADEVTQLLVGVIDGHIKGRTGGALSLGRPAAGKTGTTNENTAVWFIGYTPQIATAVWVGDPRGGFLHPIQGITVNGKYVAHGYGSVLAGPIWKATMEAALQDLPPLPFESPDPSQVKGLTVVVPQLYGTDLQDALKQLTSLGLIPTTAPSGVNSTAPVGTVVFTDPGVGAKLKSGDAITVYVSLGPLAVVAPPSPSTPVGVAPGGTGTGGVGTGAGASPVP